MTVSDASRCQSVVRSIRKDDLHTDYIPVGHSTNLAAHLEQMATPGSILITDYTRKLVEGYFELKALQRRVKTALYGTIFVTGWRKGDAKSRLESHPVFLHLGCLRSGNQDGRAGTRDEAAVGAVPHFQGDRLTTLLLRHRLALFL